jgi:hypothetical protein
MLSRQTRTIPQEHESGGIAVLWPVGILCRDWYASEDAVILLKRKINPGTADTKKSDDR